MKNMIFVLLVMGLITACASPQKMYDGGKYSKEQTAIIKTYSDSWRSFLGIIPFVGSEYYGYKHTEIDSIDNKVACKNDEFEILPGQHKLVVRYSTISKGEGKVKKEEWASKPYKVVFQAEPGRTYLVRVLDEKIVVLDTETYKKVIQ